MEISVAADELIAAGDRWQRSYQAWQRAVEHRDRVIKRAERRIVRATGDLGQRDWEAARRRRRIKTSAEASLVVRAGSARSEVQAAVEEAQRLQAVEEAAVLAARLELAEATKQVLGYGRVGQQLTGMTSAELHGLARRPRNTPAAPAR
ncbi:MAG: hypothetical protein WAV54_07830 [Acidimicrobiales bacterium]|jgi:hypothetical protein